MYFTYQEQVLASESYMLVTPKSHCIFQIGNEHSKLRASTLEVSGLVIWSITQPPTDREFGKSYSGFEVLYGRTY